jgi:acyl carrier protein
MAITENELRALVAKISGMPPEKIVAGARFADELRMDSLTSLDLLVAIEEELGVVISQAEARHIQTFGQLLEHLSVQKEPA